MTIKSIKGNPVSKPGPNVFDCFARDLFGNPDLTEWCEVGNRRVSCLVSRSGEKLTGAELAADNGEEFRLGFLESDWRQLGEVSHVTYRRRQYRITAQELDDSGLIRNISLKSGEEPQRVAVVYASVSQ